MKKMTRLFVLLMLLVLLPITASAGYIVNEATFNKTCKYHMTSASTLYRGTFHPDGKLGYYTFEAIGTLPAGKYVSVLYTYEDKTEVFYWNGGEKSAWIDDGTYIRATRTICATNGMKTSIPSLAWGDEAAVRYILSEFLSPEDVQSYIDGMKQGLGTEKDEHGEIVIVKQEPLAPPEITRKQEGAEDAKVELLLPGAAQSTVKLGGKEVAIPTAELSWALDGAEHPLAIVYAPKNGVASAYARDNGRGGVIKKLKAGSVVLVLGRSDKYTKVYGEGTVGYVITSALSFCSPCESAEEATLLSKANLRLTDRDNGRRLLELPEGARVLVLSEDGTWAQVEYEGFVGYVELNKLEK